MIIICAKLFIKSTIHDKVMGQTRTAFTEAYAQSFSAACDFDLALTHRFVISICSKLFIKSSMHDKSMGRTRTSLTEAYAKRLNVDCDHEL